MPKYWVEHKSLKVTGPWEHVKHMKMLIVELKFKLDAQQKIIKGFHKVKDSLNIMEKYPWIWADSLNIWNPTVYYLPSNTLY